MLADWILIESELFDGSKGFDGHTNTIPMFHTSLAIIGASLNIKYDFSYSKKDEMIANWYKYDFFFHIANNFPASAFNPKVQSTNDVNRFIMHEKSWKAVQSNEPVDECS